jgi:hypothetical protein
MHSSVEREITVLAIKEDSECSEVSFSDQGLHSVIIPSLKTALEKVQNHVKSKKTSTNKHIKNTINDLHLASLRKNMERIDMVMKDSNTLRSSQALTSRENLKIAKSGS